MLKLKVFITGIIILLTSGLFAQLPNLPSNLSNVTSNEITNEQVSQAVQYIVRNNISSQAIFDQLVSRGMSTTEAALVKNRVELALQEPTKASDLSTNNRSGEPRFTELENTSVVVPNDKKIFGLEIFNNGVLAFEPNLKIATPIGYVIGPDDEININIYGYQEAKYNLTVSPEGDINIPYAGITYVAGLTIEQATAKISAKLAANGYANIRTGLTKVNVSVGRIRSISVTVLGYVKKPGRYTVPSLATAFNVLYQSGGPTEIGSLRKIEVIRNGRVIQNLDVYDYITRGSMAGNTVLRDQDVIRVPAYDVRVSLTGEVKSEGLFEIVKGETLSSLLSFAGGFSDSAYTASITAYKATDTERRISDIVKREYATYQPSRSEAFVVKKLINRFTNKVSIAGAVYLPGDYELSDNLTLRDLMVKAQGLTENAFTDRGVILRYGDNLVPEYIAFNPRDVMTGKGNISLKRNDVVTVSSINDLRENLTVAINGEVRKEGTYGFVENMSLRDLVLQAGGFTEAALPQKIEIGRRIRRDTFNLNDIEVAQVININSIEDLQSSSNDIKLQPFDVIQVRRNPSYVAQVNVRAEGEVVFPGTYVLSSKNERISDLIKRAGGMTRYAYMQGGYLSRLNRQTVINRVASDKAVKIQENLSDSTTKIQDELTRPVDHIAINLSNILSRPGGKDDLVVEEGDIITIPQERMEVRISGQVLFPTRVVFSQQLNLKDYISKSGGFTDNARKKRVYILYPNGNAAKTSSFLFLKKYPEVLPGSEIIVPKKREVERRRLSTGEVIGITGALTAIGGVLIQLLKD